MSSRAQRGICSVVALNVLCASMAFAQNSVSGVVRDSATGRPLAGAHIEVRRDTVRRATQSDDEGAFQLADVSQGLQRLTVRRLGYAVRTSDLQVSDDVSIEITLVPIARDLDTLHVRAGVTGIYGVVGAADGLHPLAGAKVFVLGENRSQLTDSAGTFFVPLKRAGTYVVRITRAGYVHRVFPIAVSGAVDASRLLDSARSSTPGLDVLWEDFDQRLKRRGMNSVLVSGSEVRRAGSVELTGTFNSRGLALGGTICVYLNGTPRPGMGLDVVPLEKIEIMELYGDKDAAARALIDNWPPRAACGYINRGRRYQAPGGPRANAIAKYAVIWLKP